MREPFIAGPPRCRGLRDLSLFSDSRVRRQVRAQETRAPVVGFRQRQARPQGAWRCVRVRVREASGGYVEGGVRVSTATWRRTDDGLAQVASPYTGPVTRGTLCGKGRFGRQRVQNRG
ncbi:hypothetical protein [Streptomyces sp. NPDC093260]|uniref:hypothetical protein n=1 Tax=Streptomyces sp. NPDC093260 TaxID=3155073 RepID=UPI003440DCBC